MYRLYFLFVDTISLGKFIRGILQLSSFDLFKEILDIIYKLSGVGIIIGLYLAYSQLKQMKTDYETSNKRSSIEKSMEYLNLFATTIIPASSEYINQINRSGLQKYKGPKNKDFRFDEQCNADSKYIRDIIDASIRHDGIHILNQLEYFSASMISGLADEKLAFTPLAETFCDTVDEMYVMLCQTRRKTSSNLFSNTIELYTIWYARLQKLNLEKDREELNQKISTIDSKTIPELWKRKEG